MTTIFLQHCSLIGASTTLMLRFVFLLIQKQPYSTWLKPLLKADISGVLLGIAGGYSGCLVSTWMSGFSQQWLVILLSACLGAFLVGWILQMVLERLVWRRLGWA